MKVVITEDTALNSWNVRFYEGELGRQTLVSKLCYDELSDEREDVKIQILAAMIHKVFKSFSEYKEEELDKFIKGIID